MALVLDDFALALRRVSEVGTFGAEKYSDHGWLYVDNAEQRYRDALYRHLFTGFANDDESGLPHIAHAAWCALALLELEERRQLNFPLAT